MMSMGNEMNFVKETFIKMKNIQIILNLYKNIHITFY